MNTVLSDFTCWCVAAVFRPMFRTQIQSILMGGMMTHMRYDGCGCKVTVRQGGGVFEGHLLMVQCDEQLLVCCVDVQCHSKGFTAKGSVLCYRLVETCKLNLTFCDTTFTLTFGRAALT